jgi:hypothetical protein
MQTTSWRVRDASGWTMFIFGSLALFFGLIGLLKPELVLSTLAFNVIERAQRAAGDYTLTFVIASSMASFNVGVYYILAALNDVKAFYRWTVPFRAVTFAVFSIAVVTGLAPTGWIGVAAWELCGGIATGLALYYEKRRPASLK